MRNMLLGGKYLAIESSSDTITLTHLHEAFASTETCRMAMKQLASLVAHWVRMTLILLILPIASSASAQEQSAPANRQLHLAYITPDVRIPFWNIMTRGIRHRGEQLGYTVSAHSAGNSARRELELLAQMLRQPVDGLIISPTTSSAGATLIKLARKAGIPVVVADIGADSNDYVAFISSDNHEGAYDIGRILVRAMEQRGWQQGRVGIIAIPQKRLNGQQRTAGFMQALNEAGIQNAAMRQQTDFSHDETYAFTLELINEVSDLRAIWLQGSDRYQAALDAIADSGKKDDILLVTFDAEPEFLQLIPDGVLTGAAMQQPYLMGEAALQAMHNHLYSQPVIAEQKLPVLAISADNIDKNLIRIRRNVLGQEAAH